MGQIIFRDNQHVFDAVVKHLRQMPHQASDNHGYCQYYVETAAYGKLRCGIGGAMTVEQAKKLRDYRSGIDTLLVRTRFAKQTGIKERFQNCNPGFLRRLQRIHDEAGYWSPEGFNHVGERALERFATENGVTYTPKEG